jgi:DNA-binding NarL/FixJ family response regulator
MFAAHGAVPPGTRPELATLEFPNKARSLVKRYRQAANVLNEGQDVVSRAWSRVAMARAPAAPGKQEMKDCVIVENYLEFTRQLRAHGSAQTVVFLSSNSEDYTTGSRANVNATAMMHRPAEAKIHQGCWQEAPQRGAVSTSIRLG